MRKCVRVQLKKNNKRITAYVPRDGGMSFIDENDEVLVIGFGRSGHAVGDLPGVRFKIAAKQTSDATRYRDRENGVLN